MKFTAAIIATLFVATSAQRGNGRGKGEDRRSKWTRAICDFPMMEEEMDMEGDGEGDILDGERLLQDGAWGWSDNSNGKIFLSQRSRRGEL